MTTFWKSLAEVAKGQLFAGGHLSPALVADMAKRENRGSNVKRNNTCQDHLPWPRLAIPH